MKRKWSFAKSLTEQAYDFIATNVDIFSNSEKTYEYLSDLNNIKDRSRGRLSAREEILYHEKSSQLANMVIRGEMPPQSAKDSLLGRSWLGRAMFELHTTHNEAEKLQTVVEQLDCYGIMEMH